MTEADIQITITGDTAGFDGAIAQLKPALRVIVASYGPDALRAFDEAEELHRVRLEALELGRAAPSRPA